MSSYRKILWNEGMLLTPHHFQHWDNYHEERLNARLTSLVPYEWGVLDLQLNHEAIANGSVELVRCRAVLPDGLIVNIPQGDPAPASRLVESHFGAEAERLDVHLAIPANRSGAANYQTNGGAPGQTVRYWQDAGTVIDETTGQNEQQIAFARSNLRLLFADEMREGLRTHLYSAEHDRFARALMPVGSDSFTFDMTIDASLFGIFYFGVFDPADEVVANTMRAVEERLSVKTEIGGIARFEADGYMSVTNDTALVPGNPWFICTLWLADYYIACAQSPADLDRAMPLIEWAVARALPSGAFAEQIHPYTGAPLSVAPLTWSHSTLVATVITYIKKRLDVRG